MLLSGKDKRMYSLDTFKNFPNDLVDQSLFEITENKLKVLHGVAEVLLIKAFLVDII